MACEINEYNYEDKIKIEIKRRWDYNGGKKSGAKEEHKESLWRKGNEASHLEDGLLQTTKFRNQK